MTVVRMDHHPRCPLTVHFDREGAPSWALATLWLPTWMVPFLGAPAAGAIWAVPWAVLPLLVLTIAALRDATISRRGLLSQATQNPVIASPVAMKRPGI